MKQLPQFILRTDRDGTVLAGSTSIEAFLGSVVGRPCRQVVVATRRDGAPICAEGCVGLHASDGRTVPIDVRGAVVRDRVGRLACHQVGDETVVVLGPSLLRAGMFPDPLTPRERQVLTAISDGCTNRDIAKGLGVAASTIRTHVEHILEKLGAASRAEAVSSARDLGEIF